MRLTGALLVLLLSTLVVTATYYDVKKHRGTVTVAERDLDGKIRSRYTTGRTEYITASNDVNAGACGESFHSRQGSLNFPGNYDLTTRKCSWTFRAPVQHRLHVQITSCDTYISDTDGNRHASYPVFKVYKIESGAIISNRTETQCFYEILQSDGSDIRMDLDWTGVLYTNHTSEKKQVAHPQFQVKFWSEKLTWVVDEFPESSDTEPAKVCRNGGGPEVPCGCPPGFGGDRCEIACGPDRFGENCERVCSGLPLGCRGQRFCAGSKCRCAAGLTGPRCDQVCELGVYGSGCSEQCGRCDGGECDPYTGRCLRGCQPGYLAPYCQHALTHLLDGPKIHKVYDTYLTGSFPLDSKALRGRGAVKFFKVQYKAVSGDWVTGLLERLPTATLDELERPAFSEAQQAFTLQGLPSSTNGTSGLPADDELDVRVLLLDRNHSAFDRVPFARVRTVGPINSDREAAMARARVKASAK